MQDFEERQSILCFNMNNWANNFGPCTKQIYWNRLLTLWELTLCSFLWFCKRCFGHLTLKHKSSPISSVVPILSAAKLVGLSKLFVEIIQYIKSYCLLFYCHKKIEKLSIYANKGVTEIAGSVYVTQVSFHENTTYINKLILPKISIYLIFPKKQIRSEKSFFTRVEILWSTYWKM